MAITRRILHSVLTLMIVVTTGIALGGIGTATAWPGGSTACGSPLTAEDLTTIVDLSETSALIGSSSARLEQVAQRHHRVTEILVAHRDRRGLLPLGVDVIERAVVLPLQRDPIAFDDPEWAHMLSLELLSRFLHNLHAELIGAPTDPAWTRYFELARSCELPATQVAMAGYNAHSIVDLPYALAAAHTTPGNAEDYFTLFDMIAQHESLITTQTETIYGSDIGPLWRFYFLRAGLDAVPSTDHASGAMMRLLNAGAQAWIFGTGLALQNPLLAAAAQGEIDLLWPAIDADPRPQADGER
ncbi:hypothetical protein F3087_27025 [Nocardia colli]|uniref:Uncharacterized protein n=1 Tax=Nocardia colli TaxID=2545717 RepID=A0A5N0EBS3_9NOCA|nr:DUF5995 family protein [Nocardia colli]KAA8886240.1 hypothetical protein F3087_27025 [Nocardia colli]